jgi:hypothetical protein
VKEILATLIAAFFKINHKGQSDINMLACVKGADSWNADYL